MTDARLQQAHTWLNSLPHFGAFNVTALAGDASFRRYFRIHSASNTSLTYVLMDAPPNKEDVSPFLRVRAWLASANITVPQLIAHDPAQGFLLLEDFGDQTWAVCLESNHDSQALFEDALQQLHQLQAATPTLDLPLFDTARMVSETNLYLDWYLPHVQSYEPNIQARSTFHQALSPVLESIHALPKTPVHLDYHSRNLMLPQQGFPLGVIDFQDAVIGPLTYDLASLLYDCYQNYPEQTRLIWSEHFFHALKPQHQAHFNHDFPTWHQHLRLTALQRHIKAIGIFARLAYRDGKKQFLAEIPLTCQHIEDELTALELHIPLLSA